MCCVFAAAVLRRTLLYVGESQKNGKYVHVLGYQNRAENLTPGPNAMLLAIPSKAKMGPENMVATNKMPKVLKDQEEALETLRPLTLDENSFDESKGAVASAGFSRAVVFESGQYTVVLGESLGTVAKAVSLVPENKRPKLNLQILNAFAGWYKEWTWALCCFNQAMNDPDPLLWWYEPMKPEEFFAPGLDGHDGNAPNLDAIVDTDHSIMVGSTIRPIGVKVKYEDKLTSEAESLLASHILGLEFTEYLGKKHPNGDFIVPNNLKDLPTLTALQGKHPDSNDYNRLRHINERIQVLRKAPGREAQDFRSYRREALTW